MGCRSLDKRHPILPWKRVYKDILSGGAAAKRRRRITECGPTGILRLAMGFRPWNIAGLPAEGKDMEKVLVEIERLNERLKAEIEKKKASSKKVSRNWSDEEESRQAECGIRKAWDCLDDDSPEGTGNERWSDGSDPADRFDFSKL